MTEEPPALEELTSSDTWKSLPHNDRVDAVNAWRKDSIDYGRGLDGWDDTKHGEAVFQSALDVLKQSSADNPEPTMAALKEVVPEQPTPPSWWSQEAQDDGRDASHSVALGAAKSAGGIAGGVATVGALAAPIAAISAATGPAAPITGGVLTAGAFIGGMMGTSNLIEKAQTDLSENIQSVRTATDQIDPGAEQAGRTMVDAATIGASAAKLIPQGLKRAAAVTGIGGAAGAAMEPLRYGIEAAAQPLTGDEPAPITTGSVLRSAAMGAASAGFDPGGGGATKRVAQRASAATIRTSVDADLADMIAKPVEQVAAETVAPTEPSPVTEAIPPTASARTAPVAGEILQPAAQSEPAATPGPEPAPVAAEAREPLSTFDKVLQDDRRAYREDVASRPVEQQPPRMWYTLEAARTKGIGPEEITGDEVRAYKQMWQNAVDTAVAQNKPVYVGGKYFEKPPKKGWEQRGDLWHPPAGAKPVIRVLPDPMMRPATEPPAPATARPAAAERGQAMPFGPGKMTEGEITPTSTSNKEVQVNLERAERGLDPIGKEPAIKNQAALDMGEALLEQNPAAGKEVVAKLGSESGFDRTISRKDAAVMGAHRLRLQNERDAAWDRAVDENLTQPERDANRKLGTDAEAELNALDQAAQDARSVWGGWGQFWQQMLRNDFTVETMQRKARAEKGDPLTPEEAAEIKATSVEIKKTQDDFTKVEAAETQKHSEKTADEDFAETKKNVEESERKNKGTKKPVDAGKQREKIVDGMKKRVAEGDSANDLYAYVQKLAENFHREAIQKGETLTRDQLTDKIHSVLTDDLGLEILRKFTGDENDVNTQDLISGIGRPKDQKLTTDPVKLAKAEIRTQLQKVGKIERFLRSMAAPKTGPPRMPTSAESRKLEKEGRKIARDNGVTVTDPEKQLATSREAAKTRFRNEIADLDRAIDLKEPLVPKPGRPEYDAETQALKEQRDAKKAQYDELFPKEPLSDADWLARAEAQADRAISDLESDLKAGKLYRDPAAPRPTSAQLDAKKARLEALKSQRDELRNLDTSRVETTREAALEKAIADATKPRTGPVEGKPTVDSKRVAMLKSRLEELRSANAKDRAASPEARAAALIRAEQAAQKSLDTLDQKLREGRIAPEQKTGTGPQSDTLETIRSERDAMNALLRELREARKPKKSDAEIALQSLVTRAKTSIADLKDKAARADAGDATVFDKKKRASPLDISQSAEAMRLKATEARLKEGFLKKAHEFALANRTRAQKILGGIKQTKDAYVNIQSSIDFSAPRQALGAILSNSTRLLTNPKVGARLLYKPFEKMFSATFSENRARIIEQRQNHRPNALSGLYKRTGVETTDLHATTFTKGEENARSILDDWAARSVKGGGVGRGAVTIASRAVRGSNRAFITFLNETKLDLVDELVRAKFKDRAPTDGELRAIGNQVNIATGRGSMNPIHAKAASEVLWSPKLLVSRLQALSGQPFWGEAGRGGSLRTQAIVAEEYARTIAAGYALLVVASMFSEKKEKDPTSSDYGKVVRGHSRLDPWGGFQQVTTLASRLAQGKVKTIEGKTRNVSQYGIGNVAWDFAVNKLRPDIKALVGVVIAAVDDTMVRMGKKKEKDVRITPGEAAMNLVPIPISLGNVKTLIEDRGVPEAIALQMLNTFGAGVNTYTDEKEPTTRVRP